MWKMPVVQQGRSNFVANKYKIVKGAFNPTKRPKRYQWTKTVESDNFAVKKNILKWLFCTYVWQI